MKSIHIFSGAEVVVETVLSCHIKIINLRAEIRVCWWKVMKGGCMLLKLSYFSNDLGFVW